MRKVLRGSVIIAVALLGACASSELVWREFEGETMFVDMRIAPDAQIRPDYDVTVDAKDPVGTILSVGSAVAQATQVEEATRRMNAAVTQDDMRLAMEDEVKRFFDQSLGMDIAAERRGTVYRVVVLVERYGIEASSFGDVAFVLEGVSTMYDETTGTEIWRRGFYAAEEISPAVFGIPAAAGNILSAAMLAEVEDEELAEGIMKVARDASWQVGVEFEEDLYEARRRR